MRFETIVPEQAATLGVFAETLPAADRQAIHHALGRFGLSEMAPVVELPEILDDSIARSTHEQYRSWQALAHEDATTQATIALHAAGLRAFAPFESQVRQLLAEKPEALAVGSTAYVHAITKDSEQFAVRLPRWEEAVPHAYFADLVGGKGIRGAEQVVAYSYRYGAVVSEWASGKPGYRMTPEDMLEIQATHLPQALDTLEAMSAQGLYLDQNAPKFGNTLYDPTNGLTFVDYMHNEGLGQVGGAVADVCAWLGMAGTAATKDRNDPRYGEVRGRRVALLAEFGSICMERYGEDTYAARSVRFAQDYLSAEQ